MHLINKYKEAGTGNPARDERHNLPDSMFSKEQKNIFKTSWVFFRKNNLRFSEEAGVPMWVDPIPGVKRQRPAMTDCVIIWKKKKGILLVRKHEATIFRLY